jgi:hypothetical protein
MLHKKLLLAVGLLFLANQSLEAVKAKKRGRFLSKIKRTLMYPLEKTGEGVIYCAQKTKDGCEYVIEKSFDITKVTAKYGTVIIAATTVGLVIYVYHNSEKISVETMKELANAGLSESEQLTDIQLEAMIQHGAVHYYWQLPFGPPVPVTKNFVGNINTFVEYSTNVKDKTQATLTAAVKVTQNGWDTTKGQLNALKANITEMIQEGVQAGTAQAKAETAEGKNIMVVVGEQAGNVQEGLNKLQSDLSEFLVEIGNPGASDITTVQIGKAAQEVGTLAEKLRTSSAS